MSRLRFGLVLGLLFFLAACLEPSQPTPPPQEPPNVEDNLPGDALLTIGLSVDPTTETVTLVSVNGQTGGELELERYLDRNDLKFASGTTVFDRDSNPQTLTLDVILTNKRDYGFENFTLAASPLYETSTSATFKAVQSMLYDVNKDATFDTVTESMYQRPGSFTTQVVDPAVSFPNSGFMEPVGGTYTKLVAPLRVAFTPGERFSVYIAVDADEVVSNPELDPNTETITATFGDETASVASIGIAPHVVAFDAGGSAGTDLTYAWDFGDGNAATGAYVEHTYDSAGTYSVSLTATNSVGRMVTSTQTVSVLPDFNDPTLRSALNLKDTNTLNFDLGDPVPGLSYQ